MDRKRRNILLFMVGVFIMICIVGFLLLDSYVGNVFSLDNP